MAKGYGTPVESPKTFVFTPMQVLMLLMVLVLLLLVLLLLLLVLLLLLLVLLLLLLLLVLLPLPLLLLVLLLLLLLTLSLLPQINTRNPDGSGKRCGMPGTNCPLPHQQNAWKAGDTSVTTGRKFAKNAPWSGILECPCNFGVSKSRMIKTFDHHGERNSPRPPLLALASRCRRCCRRRRLDGRGSVYII